MRSHSFTGACEGPRHHLVGSSSFFMQRQLTLPISGMSFLLLYLCLPSLNRIQLSGNIHSWISSTKSYPQIGNSSSVILYPKELQPVFQVWISKNQIYSHNFIRNQSADDFAVNVVEIGLELRVCLGTSTRNPSIWNKEVKCSLLAGNRWW